MRKKASSNPKIKERAQKLRKVLVTKKRRSRRFPEVIIEPSGEKIDLVEFIEAVLDFEEE